MAGMIFSLKRGRLKEAMSTMERVGGEARVVSDEASSRTDLMRAAT